MTSLPTLLYVDPDGLTGLTLSENFEAAHLSFHALVELDRALTAARQVRPGLVVIRSSSHGDVLARVLKALGADANFANLPMVLISDDVSEHDFVSELRTGVIAVLSMPEDPGQLIRELRAHWEGLPRRSGITSGTLDSPGLTALVEHLRRTGRSGSLTLNGGPPGGGTAFFARGILQSAAFKDLTGSEALFAMVAQPKASFSFAELGADGGEAVIDIELAMGSEDEPFVPVEHAEPVSEEILLSEVIPEVLLEVGDVGTGEEEVPVAKPPRRAAKSTPILLVDDDDALCAMFSILFRKHGFEVTTASDGFAGYEAARDGSFDLVVADLNMPRMDGWGMLRLLRDDHRTRETPVAFLSCHDDYRESLKALNAGAQAYFSKSTRLDALAAQVRGLLEPREEARQALATGERAPLPVSRVGPQWVLRQLAASGATGVLEAKDNWAEYQVGLREGVPTYASAQSGRHLAEGMRAFVAFIASRGADGAWAPGAQVPHPNLSGSLEALLAQTVDALNENGRRVRESLLVHATQVEVNGDLYALYAQVGPRAWLETARLICEDKLPPREVIARVDASPLDVEETLKDLVRRGVVTLSA